MTYSKFPETEDKMEILCQGLIEEMLSEHPGLSRRAGRQLGLRVRPETGPEY